MYYKILVHYDHCLVEVHGTKVCCLLKVKQKREMDVNSKTKNCITLLHIYSDHRS